MISSEFSIQSEFINAQKSNRPKVLFPTNQERNQPILIDKWMLLFNIAQSFSDIWPIFYSNRMLWHGGENIHPLI